MTLKQLQNPPFRQAYLWKNSITQVKIVAWVDTMASRLNTRKFGELILSLPDCVLLVLEVMLLEQGIIDLNLRLCCIFHIIHLVGTGYWDKSLSESGNLEFLIKLTQTLMHCDVIGQRKIDLCCCLRPDQACCRMHNATISQQLLHEAALRTKGRRSGATVPACGRTEARRIRRNYNDAKVGTGYAGLVTQERYMEPNHCNQSLTNVSPKGDLNCRAKYAIMDGMTSVLLIKWIRTNAQAAQVNQVRQRLLFCAYKYLGKLQQNQRQDEQSQRPSSYNQADSTANMNDGGNVVFDIQGVLNRIETGRSEDEGIRNLLDVDWHSII